MKRRCGNCRFWIKTKAIKGLCDKYDLGLAFSDCGAGCKGWKRIGDDKPKEKLSTKASLYGDVIGEDNE